MDILEWYFGFNRRDTFFSAVRSKRWSFFAHVEVWGYTKDGTWVFFNPEGEGSKLHVTHHADDVDDLFAARLVRCTSVLRVAPFSKGIRIPIHPTMNCASQCAHLVGVRAYTPWRLMRILRENGAVEIKNGKDTQGRS